jgi:tRNA threonylcarbamoyladenosine biosynthesis protein TsaE
MDCMELQFVSRSEEETQKLAGALAAFLNEGDLILLDGELGTGKTHFVKGIAQGMGSRDNVTSPTFSLANFYKTDRADILHIDVYRIETMAEFADTALSDYFPQCVVLVEWGAKFEAYFDDYLSVSIDYLEAENQSRKITLRSQAEQYFPALNRLAQTISNS